MTSTHPVPSSSLEASASPEVPASPEAHPKELHTDRPKRARRSAELFDAEGNPAYINLTCLCCKEVKPLAAFGLRKMPNGIVRNQPWCRSCRSSKSSETKAAAAATAKAAAAPPAKEGKTP